MTLAVVDDLESIGIVAGVLLVGIGLGTLVGTPWTYSNSAIVAVASVVGTIALIGIGIGLIWLVRSESGPSYS